MNTTLMKVPLWSLRQSADHLVVKATLPVSRFNQLVKTALDETEFDTLGGAVTDQFGTRSTTR